ncbi:MAG: hypothetical protein CMJ64_06115 [Planctomycetaceae bacterium]|nr:hypothetical protein [Planctomycetaceae bacterium]
MLHCIASPSIAHGGTEQWWMLGAVILITCIAISVVKRKVYPLGCRLVFCVLILLLLPAVSNHPRSPRMYCSNHLKQIALALHHYHVEWDSLPPPVTYGEDGRAMHSWRELILPYLDAEGLDKTYRLDEPWNGPHNSQLITAIPGVFQCSEAGSDASRTNYLAVVSSRGSQPQAAWTDGSAIRFRDFLDGTSNAILIVESCTDSVVWTEPCDLRYETLPLAINHEIGVGLSSKHPGGCQFVLADGSVRFVSQTLPAETLRKLLLRNDGEDVGDRDYW